MRTLLEPKNRVILLDVVIFLVNLMLVSVLAPLFARVTQDAQTNVHAKLVMLVFCVGLCILSPAAAILKRRAAHRRNPELGGDGVGRLWILYFVSQLMFWTFAGVMYAELQELAYGDRAASTRLFLPLFAAVPLSAGVNTLIFFFYFRKPKGAARSTILDSWGAESLGDALLFVNLIGYQVFWVHLMTQLPRDDGGLFDRLFTFVFTAALIYLPPRLFYLIEHYQEPRVWWAMLISNSPVIVRLFLR